MKYKYEYPEKADSCVICLESNMFPWDNRREETFEWAINPYKIFVFATSIGNVCPTCIDKLEENDPDFAIGLGVTKDEWGSIGNQVQGS